MWHRLVCLHCHSCIHWPTSYIQRSSDKIKLPGTIEILAYILSKVFGICCALILKENIGTGLSLEFYHDQCFILRGGDSTELLNFSF